MSKTVKNAIDTDKLLDWLVENSVLSIALEGKKLGYYKVLCKTPTETVNSETTYFNVMQ